MFGHYKKLNYYEIIILYGCLGWWDLRLGLPSND